MPTKFLFPELNNSFYHYLKNSNDLIYNPHDFGLKYPKLMTSIYIRSNNIFKLLLEDTYTSNDYIHTFMPVDRIIDFNLERIIYSKPQHYYRLYVSDKMGDNIFNFNDNHLLMLDLILQSKKGNSNIDLNFVINDNKSKILSVYLYFLKNDIKKMINIYGQIDKKFNDIFEEILYIFLGNKILTNIQFNI
jgi:hypothetical protein